VGGLIEGNDNRNRITAEEIREGGIIERNK
jgi:hypothetical protein